jgi:uncharacterized protein (DUF2126 family)/transglutaminase-like putative cysteine protease
MIRTKLRHVTDYTYASPVQLGPQVVRLRPAPHCRTPIAAYSLRILPGDNFCNWQQDPFGNWQARLVFPKPCTRFRVEIDLVAEMSVINPFDFFLEPDCEQWPFAYDADSARDLAPFLVVGEDTPLVAALVAAFPRHKRRTVDALVDVNTRINQAVRYTIRLEPGVQTPEETLVKGSGSCRDSAWLMVQVLRRLGLAARFASGYLIQLTADEKSLDGPSGPEKDFTDLHAWCEVYIPGAGWIGLDPTSGLFCSEGHIPLACTPEPSTAAAISGGFAPIGAETVESTMNFHMDVLRIHEDPRQTKPYREDQWQDILAAGDAVDQRLTADDVRLTMGGEPTFVGIDHPDLPEWNTAALGADKRAKAGDLVRRLWKRFAPGGVLHTGQGKWYPGEQLPRWALSLFWRTDGAPVWRDPALIAGDPPGPGADFPAARRFAKALAKRLGLDAGTLVTGYEDAVYYLWRERRLPVNVGVLDAKLDDPLERDRLAKIFAQGLGHAVGVALPVAGWRGHFSGGKWDLRSDRMFLLPGDSPMGWRLPLDTLPHAPGDQRIGDQPREPFAARAPLMQYPGQPDPQATPFVPADGIVRTALCVEPRDGTLCVFLPPLPDLESFLSLMTAIEDVAGEQSRPVQLDGYGPVHDPRLKRLAVTPDPGVIEVNIHPAATWQEAVQTTLGVYEDATASRLRAEKFLVDGRHTGTGGGNHVVLGAATPNDSPFLRRPDLLASMVAYWTNHPSLSYLFSSLFIGPTSQAPRIDEARMEHVHEVDLALKTLARSTGWKPNWLVDRTLRNLLVDLTGNTHRTEFCIDKLFSPDSSTGRLGLLELRGFEMPPHPRMSCVQQLLVRSLLSRFWRDPYTTPPVRWGTEIHDRWMLPQVVMDDLGEVVDDLRRHDLPVDATWFDVHREFRFPLIARFDARSVGVELRTALEPWHVLGEEASGGGTARYVDSSLERLQIMVDGITDGRHAVTVNGRRLPLRPTHVRGRQVAGVRFRAWQPPNCLHPTIGVNGPLVVDLVDTWNDAAIAGCTYQVSHPGGRNEEHLPINVLEAESRRNARIELRGHTPGRVVPPPIAIDPEYPYTLDLRR